MEIAYQNLSKEELISEIIELKNAISGYKEQEIRLITLQNELAQLKRMIFGSRSERFIPAVNPQQTTLDLNTATIESKPAEKESITYERKKPISLAPVTHKRLPLPEHLERVIVTIEPNEDITGLKAIGKEVTEELDYKPGKLFVKRYERTKYVKAENAEVKQEIIIGELPSRPIEKGIPGPGLLAQIIIDKYVDHLPCYRQIQRYERTDGMKIPASTMSEWLKAGCSLLEPLYEVMKQQVLKQTYLQADETPIKVLDKEKKGKTHLGYYWVYHAPMLNLTLYEYQAGRDRAGPREMLKSFKGRLQTDGYAVYESLNNPEIRLINCMAHARREFDEARSNDAAIAEYALSQIQLLYEIERRARDSKLISQQRLELRQKESVPILTSLEKWMKETALSGKVLPKTPIGKALAYSLERWSKLSFYATDGEVEIDNNTVENAIRPVALGRKNYLFAGSHHAAQRAAMLYSLLNSCKRNSIEPWQWLVETLTRLPDHKANKLHQLLPLNNNFPGI